MGAVATILDATSGGGPQDPRPIARYDAFRKQIEWEDSLFGQRITWLFALQALLMPYFYVTSADMHGIPQVTHPVTAEEYVRPWIRSELVTGKATVGIVGLVSCFLVLLSCRAAQVREQALMRQYDKGATGELRVPDWLPDIRSSPWVTFRGRLTYFGSIALFAVMWAKLLAVDFPDWRLAGLAVTAGFGVSACCVWFLAEVLADPNAVVPPRAIHRWGGIGASILVMAGLLAGAVLDFVPDIQAGRPRTTAYVALFTVFVVISVWSVYCRTRRCSRPGPHVRFARVIVALAAPAGKLSRSAREVVGCCGGWLARLRCG